MRKLVVFLLLILTMVVCSACGSNSTTAIIESSLELPPIVNDTEQDTNEQKTNLSLSVFDTVKAEDIAYIERYNAPIEEKNVTYWTSYNEIRQLLEWFQSIRTNELVSMECPAWEGSGGSLIYFNLYCFDGSVISQCFVNDTVELVTSGNIEGYYTYNAKEISFDEPNITLNTPAYSYALTTEDIVFSIHNDSGKDQLIVNVPDLKYMGQSAWEEVDPDIIGFCGTPASLPSGITNISLKLPWYKDLRPGTYRISYKAILNGRMSDELVISTIFHLVDGETSPFYIFSKGIRTTPQVEFAYSRKWMENGWLYADGIQLGIKLPQIYQEIPSIALTDDFVVQYAEGWSFDRLAVYNTNFEKVSNNEDLSLLKTLPDGDYYVGIYAKKDGKYIESEKDYEYTGFAGIFKLQK